MTSAPASAPHQHSRLIRFLSDLAVADIEASHRDFADRLGQLLDFGASIILADALKARRTPKTAAPVPSIDTVQADFLRTQNKLVSNLILSCTPGQDSPRLRWPQPKKGRLPDSFEPYRRFYAAAQRELDAGARALRASVRDAMTGVSARLDQLAALDVALDDTLWDHSRSFFAVVPVFLEKRFNHFFAVESPAPGALEQFRRELQGLLLAELEVRLQPALGLLEALAAETCVIDALPNEENIHP